MLNKKHIKAPISVIIPCFQAESTINRAVNSILQQSLKISEIILIDDASSDNTSNVINELASKYEHLISVISLSVNSGPSSARNIGWDRASFEYVAFLDADDAWHPKKIEIQYDFLKNHPECCLIGHQHQINNHKPQEWSNLSVNFKVKKLKSFAMLFFSPFATPTVIIKRNIPYRFDDHMRYAEDYFLWLQIAFSDKLVCKINLPLAATFKPNYGVQGLSSDLIKMKQGVDQTYCKLYSLKLISRITFIILKSISFLNHYKRLIIITLRSFKKKNNE